MRECNSACCLHCNASMVLVLALSPPAEGEVSSPTVLVSLQEFVEGNWQQSNLDAGANRIVAVPSPLAGVLIIGESVIAYLNHTQSMRCTDIKQTNITVCALLT